MTMLVSSMKNMTHILGFLIFFVGDIITSNIRIAFDVIRPQPRLNPGVIAIPLHNPSDLRVTMLANLITMTPGTLSLDISSDHKTLYIHAMYINNADELRKDILQNYVERLWRIIP